MQIFIFKNFTNVTFQNDRKRSLLSILTNKIYDCAVDRVEYKELTTSQMFQCRTGFKRDKGKRERRSFLFFLEVQDFETQSSDFPQSN